MISGRFSGYFLAAAITASITIPVPLASANETPWIAPLTQVQFDRWAEVPEEFHLTGQIIDDEGNPIRGAAISARGESGEIELTRSGRGGVFEIAESLSPSTRLIIRHRMFAPRYVDAGALYKSVGEPVQIEIFLYTERFDITPQGGTYQSGQLVLEVPEGAVTEPVTILATQLPLDFSYNHDGTPEPVRLTSVDLKPHGLTFAKPVTLTMTIDREDMGEITDPVSFYYDEARDRYVHDPLGTVEVKGHRAAITLSHFSPHATVDGRRAQSTLQLGRSSDVDGDGAVTPSDALFMLLASGGTQNAHARYAQPTAGSVRKITTNSKLAQRRAAPASFDFLGTQFPVSPAMPRLEARSIAERFSLGRRWEKIIRARLEVQAEEYEFDCKLLLGRYAFYRAADWQRVKPGLAEMTMIKEQWDALAPDKNQANNRFAYFNWQGSRDLVIAPALPGKLSLPGIQKIAVTMGEDGLVVYVEANSYIIAKARDGVTGACPGEIESDLWASTDGVFKGVRGHEARRDAVKGHFHFGSTAGQSRDSLAWGTFNRDELDVYSDMKCESEERQVWNYSVTWKEASNNAQAQTRIWTTPSLPTTRTNGKPVNSVDWLISNPHKRTFSEHLSAGLFKQTPDGAIPFGFMLHRIGERPCGATPTPPVAGPGEPTISEPNPGRPYGLASRSN